MKQIQFFVFLSLSSLLFFSCDKKAEQPSDDLFEGEWNLRYNVCDLPDPLPSWDVGDHIWIFNSEDKELTIIDNTPEEDLVVLAPDTYEYILYEGIQEIEIIIDDTGENNLTYAYSFEDEKLQLGFSHNLFVCSLGLTK